METLSSSESHIRALDGPDTLILDPQHPGINDETYVTRRHEFFNTSREWRLKNKGIPHIVYRAGENAVWRDVSRKLTEVHEKHACRMYLDGKGALGFETEAIPQPAEVDARLRAITGLGLVPAEGLIPFRGFFSYLANKKLPCTQYVRHASRPAFTPEPDVIHDMIGHVPQLANHDYVALIAAIGQATKDATDAQLRAFERLYWFAIEFGLIEEAGQIKMFGAGLLSSFGEMRHALSDEVTRLPFDIDVVITTDYDPSRMQDTLFVIQSFAQLRDQTLDLIKRFELARG